MNARRHLSILFADLVGYTALSEDLDPELLGEVQHAFQALIAEIVGEHGGFVASCWGDSAMAYFGFPEAHENDAERAVTAGLKIVAQVPGLSVRELPEGANLSVRVGLHTGLVVVGPELLGTGNVESNVVGMAANLAARLQAEAIPNTVVASGDTMTLVQGLFDAEPLGHRAIRGLSRTVEVFRVLGSRRGGGRSQARMARGSLRMIGRQSALAQLRGIQARTAQGACQLVQVIGAAGIGKSRLVQEFCSELDLPPLQLMAVGCSEMYASTPLYPAAGILWSKAGLRPEQDEAEQQGLLREFLAGRNRASDDEFEAACGLLGLRYSTASPSVPVQVRRRQFDLIAGLVERVARTGPCVLWVDDVHWLDPSSAELLVEIRRRLADAPLLMIVTQRAFPAVQGLPASDEAIWLHQLEVADALELARSVPGTDRLPAADLARVVDAAEGIPLFIEQLIFSLLREQREAGAATPALHVPLSLSEMMSSRLDRVKGGRRFAQAAACVGRVFGLEFLSSVLGLPWGETAALAQLLVDAEILRPAEGGTDEYVFNHSLLQQVAYDSMLRSERQRTHAAIYRLLSEGDVNRPALPEVLAQHLTHAGQTVAAAKAWIEAGGKAARRSAHTEALAHFQNATALLDQITDVATRHELDVRILVGQIAPIAATRGSASRELEACCRRGLNLSLAASPSPAVFPFLYGQCTVLMSRANAAEGLQLAQTFVSLSDRQGYAVGRVIAHRLVGMAHLMLGALAQARDEVELSLRLYDEAGRPPDTELYGQNALVHGGALLGLTYFCLGEVDRGIEAGLNAVHDADELRHPHSTAIAIGYVCWLLGLSGAAAQMNRLARRMIRISEAHALGVFHSIGKALLGWSFCLDGDLDQGIALLDGAIAELKRAEFGMAVPGYLAILADAQRQRGRLAEAHRLSADACATVGAANVWLEPEVLRVAAHLAGPERLREQLAMAAGRARALASPVMEWRCLQDLHRVATPGERPGLAARLAGLPFMDLAARVDRGVARREQAGGRDGGGRGGWSARSEPMVAYQRRGDPG